MLKRILDKIVLLPKRWHRFRKHGGVYIYEFEGDMMDGH